MIRRALPVLVWIALASCDDDVPRNATFVQPTFGDPCRYQECSGHGVCVALPAGEPGCECDIGYGGARCGSCGPEAHRDANNRCVLDRTCKEQPENPCGDHGACVDGDGVIACTCDAGYAGPRCGVCASGYGFDAFEDCLQRVLPPGAGSTGGTMSQAGTSGDGDIKGGASGGGTSGGGTSGGGTSGGATTGGGGGSGGGPPPELPVTCAADACDGHGSCAVEGTTTVCTCDTGYAAPDCASCATGYVRGAADACVLDEEESDPCEELDCGTHGSCQLVDNVAACSCDFGYAPPLCTACATGFHQGNAGTCVPDSACDGVTCGGHGQCAIVDGKASCQCDTGYMGNSCTGCAPGYTSDGAGGCQPVAQCLPTECDPIRGCLTGCEPCPAGQGRAGDGCRPCPTGPVRFDLIYGFPAALNNCFALSQPLVTEGMTFSSIGGDGIVWTCAENNVYHVESKHISLEAGAQYPAEIIFDGPVRSLTFSYASHVTGFDLELSGDGQVLDRLTLGRNQKGSLALTLDPPIERLSMLSLTGKTVQISLDDVSYELATCE